MREKRSSDMESCLCSSLPVESPDRKTKSVCFAYSFTWKKHILFLCLCSQVNAKTTRRIPINLGGRMWSRSGRNTVNLQIWIRGQIQESQNSQRIIHGSCRNNVGKRWACATWRSLTGLKATDGPWWRNEPLQGHQPHVKWESCLFEAKLRKNVLKLKTVERGSDVDILNREGQALVFFKQKCSLSLLHWAAGAVGPEEAGDVNTVRPSDVSAAGLSARTCFLTKYELHRLCFLYSSITVKCPVILALLIHGENHIKSEFGVRVFSAPYKGCGSRWNGDTSFPVHLAFLMYVLHSSLKSHSI